MSVYINPLDDTVTCTILDWCRAGDAIVASGRTIAKVVITDRAVPWPGESREDAAAHRSRELAKLWPGVVFQLPECTE